MADFGTIKKVDIREIWKNEATDFTPWLADNIEKLGELIGLELEFIEKEADVGDYSLDILAKDTGRNKYVIIENQYGKTDHKHLGQLLTYAAGYNAGAVIWLSEDIREEHRKVLDWLNEITNEDVEFYGVLIEVIKIDDSKPAFNFKLVAYPNEWSKASISSSRNSGSTKMEDYRKYFQALIDTLRTKHKFTEAKKGQPQSWYSFTTGIKGILYSGSFAMGGKVRAEIYIDKGDNQINKSIFDNLLKIKSTFAGYFDNESLSWERLDDKRASRIAIYRSGNIDDDSETLENIRTWMIAKLIKFKEIINKEKEIKKILKDEK